METKFTNPLSRSAEELNKIYLALEDMKEFSDAERLIKSGQDVRAE